MIKVINCETEHIDKLTELTEKHRPANGDIIEIKKFLYRLEYRRISESVEYVYRLIFNPYLEFDKDIFSDIEKSTALIFDVELKDIFSNCRKVDVVMCRNFLIDILHHYGLTYRQIGERYNKNHSTVIHSLNKVNDIVLSKDKVYYPKIKQAIKINNLQNIIAY